MAEYNAGNNGQNTTDKQSGSTTGPQYLTTPTNKNKPGKRGAENKGASSRPESYLGEKRGISQRNPERLGGPK